MLIGVYAYIWFVMAGLSIIPVEMWVERGWSRFTEELRNKLDGLISDGDIVVYASKPLLIAKGFIVKTSEVKPSNQALELARRYNVEPVTAELAIRYSEYVLGGVDQVLLTISGGVFTANGGVDRKNVGLDMASLPPHLLRGTACELKEMVDNWFGVSTAAVIIDSVVYPLRMGTRAYAVDVCGLKPLEDYRGRSDLYGRTIKFTVLNIADEVASAAHLVMGEGAEAKPIAVVKGLENYVVDNAVDGTDMLKIHPMYCLYRELYPKELLR